ncbi:hypothetical protein J5N58_08195 [Rhizobium cremeum]|uniref:hypothetical protein n=1 Tax=Rhizobium cremeum TaxID=2813827 RepID=UPI001FD0AF12|nr:hypothetical protein [Rhizobium cremeum]MCJ7995901.1 hypothetical protein [Rhizobium cremeum]MCJ7999656.1 hypothetical protein [Rhizobium cremeum]
MSAMLSVVQQDRVHVFADAAFYAPDTGVLTGIGPKIWPVHGIHAVFTSRGDAAAFPMLDGILREIKLTRFDDLVWLLPHVFEDLHNRLSGQTCEVMVAGFSAARNRPEVYWWCNHKGWDGLEPGNVYRLEGVSQFGLDRDDLPSAHEFKPADAVSAFQKGREHLNDLHCGESGVPFMAHSIGGGVMHVELTADGCSGSWLHTWVDVVGEPIDPFAVTHDDGSTFDDGATYAA